jgi:hypothetical protein
VRGKGTLKYAFEFFVLELSICSYAVHPCSTAPLLSEFVGSTLERTPTCNASYQCEVSRVPGDSETSRTISAGGAA